ncbi:MAG: efflux RND transporter periplasmic adaptor subunit [Pseudomonadota bacterium]
MSAPFFPASWPLRPAVAALLSVLLWLCPGSLLAAAAATPVGIAKISQLQLDDQIALVGTVIPRRITQISSQVDGLIQAVLVEEGTQVSAGQPLFRLDPAFAQIAVDRRRAELAQAEAERDDAARQLDESTRLRKDGHIPQSTLEAAITRAAVTQAVVGQRQADLKDALERLRRHRVTAPFAGTVVAKQAEVGQWLRIDSPAIELSQLDQVRVQVAVPQDLIQAVAIGTPGTLRFDAQPGDMVQASVVAVIPRGTDNARTFPIWLELDNRDGRYVPGMSAQVRLGFAGRNSLALVAPNDALVRRADGSTVIWVVEETEGALTSTPVPVRPGRSDAGYTELLGSGLTVGANVVVRGNETLRPGQPVRIVQPSAAGR